MASSFQDNEKFKQGLLEDVAKAETMAQQGAAGKGVGLEEPEFSPRAVRIGGKIIGEKEIANANRAINTAIDSLVSESGMVDEIEQGKFRLNMERKFNKFKMMAIQRAQAIEMEATRRGLDQEKKQALYSALGGAMGMFAKGIIGGAGKKAK